MSNIIPLKGGSVLINDIHIKDVHVFDENENLIYRDYYNGGTDKDDIIKEAEKIIAEGAK